MIEIGIPDFQRLQLAHRVLDYSGGPGREWRPD